MANNLNLPALEHDALSSQGIPVLDVVQTQAGWPSVRNIKQEGAHWEGNELSGY